MNASQIIGSGYEQNGGNYEWFIARCEENGIKRELFEKDLVQMFFVDFIIGNKDRHYRNFGFLRNSATLEWIGLAPVYDSGNSLFEGLADVDLENPFFTSSKNIPAKPFAFNHADQIRLPPIKRFCKSLNFSRLEGFSGWVMELLKSNHRLTDNRKKSIAERVEERIIEAKSLSEGQES